MLSLLVAKPGQAASAQCQQIGTPKVLGLLSLSLSQSQSLLQSTSTSLLLLSPSPLGMLFAFFGDC